MDSQLSRRAVLSGTGAALTTGVPVSGSVSARSQGALVCVGSADGAVYGVDARTGDRRWVFRSGSTGVLSSPTAVDGTVFVGARGSNPESGALYAIDAVTGNQEWAFTGPDQPVDSSPTVVDGTVFVGARDGRLYAVDATTGTREWTFAELTGGVGFSAPTVTGDTVALTALDGSLYAVDAGTGTLRWRFDDRLVDTTGSPAATGDGVYTLTTGFSVGVTALDRSTGDRGWNQPLPSLRINSSPTLADDSIYSSAYDGTVYALARSTGTQQWARKLPASVSLSSPTVAGGTVYVGSEAGTVHALDASSGADRWRFTGPSGAVRSSPTALDGTVYAGTMDGQLYAVDAVTGDREWTFARPEGPVVSAPTALQHPETGDSVGSRVALATLGHVGPVGHRGREPSPLPGLDSLPRDLDGDGLYEDVDGDGALTVADVQALLVHRERAPVRNNPAAFDFSPDSPPDRVTRRDVQALFDRLLSR